jgi:hypothetical protein
VFTPGCYWVRVTRSLVLNVCFVDRCLSLCTFSAGICAVCPSIYGFWLPLTTGGEHRCPGRVGSSCCTSDTRRVNLVTNPVINREWGKAREVLMTSGTYPWSCVTQLCHSGQPRHGDFNLPKILIGTVSSVISYHLRDKYSICRCCWVIAKYIWKVHNGKI